MENKLGNKEKFYQEMLNKHLKKFEFDGRVQYLVKVLDKSKLISPNLKEAIYLRTEVNHKAIEERINDDFGEIRHNYGAADYGRGEAEARARKDYNRDMNILKVLEEKVSRMKDAELGYKEGGAGI
jgi:hypothetical protein